MWENFLNTIFDVYAERVKGTKVLSAITTLASPACSCPSSLVVEVAALWLEGLAIPLLGGAGILGNLAAILVLRQATVLSSFLLIILLPLIVPIISVNLHPKCCLEMGAMF